MIDAPEKIWVDTIRDTDDGAIIAGGEFPLSTGGINYTRTDIAEAAERAAYLRGLEDAAKVAENWNSHVSELTDAIRALAKEDRE